MSDSPKTPWSLDVYAFLIVASIAFMVTVFVSSHWIEIHLGDYTTIYVGLLKICVETMCYDSDESAYVDLDFDTYIYSCVTAIVCYALAMVTIAHLVCVQRMSVSSTTHGWITLALALIGAGATTHTVGHFRGAAGLELDDHYSTWNYGYCLPLAAVSVLTSVVAGMSALIATNSLANSWREQNTETVVVPVPGTEMAVPTQNVLYTVETTATTQRF